MLKERDIFKMFARRVLIDTISYWLALILVMVFYHLDTGKQVEILYPSLIAIVIYVIWIAIRYVTYSNFFHSIDKMKHNSGFSGRYTKQDQIFINKAFNQVHHKYIQDISSMKVKEREERRFLSAWIHSMKTPVSVIDLVIQRLERGELKEQQIIEDVKQENDTLLQSLDTVLNMVRLQEFSKDYVPEPFDLLEEVKWIINNNKRRFIYGSVYPKIIDECTNNDSKVVLSDRKWNRNMLDQLISNAIKYSKKDEESKEIIFRISKEGKKTVLYIEDQGIGIESTDLARVFEPFFTGENGRVGTNSSGIGLYFCKEISENIQCDLGITSQVGIGTQVKITYLNYPSDVLSN